MPAADKKIIFNFTSHNDAYNQIGDRSRESKFNHTNLKFKLGPTLSLGSSSSLNLSLSLSLSLSAPSDQHSRSTPAKVDLCKPEVPCMLEEVEGKNLLKMPSSCRLIGSEQHYIPVPVVGTRASIVRVPGGKGGMKKRLSTCKLTVVLLE